VSSYALPLATATTTIALAYQLWRLWLTRHTVADRAARRVEMAICTVLATEAAATAVSWPPVYLGLDRATGVHNLAALIVHQASLLGIGGIQAWLLHLTHSRTATRRIHRRAVALAICSTIMILIFGLAHPTAEAPDGFIAHTSNSPDMTPYLIIYLIAVTAGAIDILAMSLTTDRHTTNSAQRVATRLLTVSAVIALILATGMTALAIATRAHTELGYNEAAVSHPGIAVGATLLTAGLLIPSLLPLVADIRRMPRRRRLYRQMHPLWLALIRAVPHVSLNPPRHPERDHTWWLTGSYRRMYRRVIEIYDGLHRLGDHFDPDIRTTAYRNALAAGADNQHAAALAEAVAIAAALHELNTGAPPRDHRQTPPTNTDDGNDVEADAAWLARVSAAFTTYDSHLHQVHNRNCAAHG
jgi:hypothetical protein